jgi:hypothetical protein
MTDVRASLCAATFVLVFAVLAPLAVAVEMLDLYQARPVVTGTGEKNRQIGFALALEEVLVKVSGDARLLGDPRVAQIDPAALVAKFTYRDRMSRTEIHDEQGSYDRPHDLTVTFDRAKLDAALAALGLEPWRAERPTLVVFLSVKNGTNAFVLSADGERGAAMRESLDNATFRVNIPAKLPTDAALAAAGLSVATLPDADLAALDPSAKAVGGGIAILGALDFSDAAHGWITHWRMRGSDGAAYEWGERGVSFDDAFRSAVRGAAQVLSGHGAPE